MPLPILDESILENVKKACGLQADYHAFDDEIIMDINAVMLILYQRGIGSDSIFSISDETSKWSDFMEDDRIAIIAPYVGAKVRLMFDPPQNTTANESLKDKANELEWRLSIEFDDTYVSSSTIETDEDG